MLFCLIVLCYVSSQDCIDNKLYFFKWHVSLMALAFFTVKLSEAYISLKITLTKLTIRIYNPLVECNNELII